MRVEDAPTRFDIEAEVVASRDKIFLEEWQGKFDRWIKMGGVDPGETKVFRLGWVTNKEPRYSEDMKRISRFKRSIRAEGWEEVEALFEEPSGSMLTRPTWRQWFRLAPPTYVKNGWERSHSIFNLSFKRPLVVDEVEVVDAPTEEAASSVTSGEGSGDPNEVQTL